MDLFPSVSLPVSVSLAMLLFSLFLLMSLCDDVKFKQINKNKYNYVSYQLHYMCCVVFNSFYRPQRWHSHKAQKNLKRRQNEWNHEWNHEILESKRLRKATRLKNQSRNFQLESKRKMWLSWNITWKIPKSVEHVWLDQRRTVSLDCVD